MTSYIIIARDTHRTTEGVAISEVDPKQWQAALDCLSGEGAERQLVNALAALKMTPFRQVVLDGDD